MAEQGSRRPSFRKARDEGALPSEYLDSLEQKRRQLDESIHKYIAAKEREYKLYERDLRHQLKVVYHDGDRDTSDRTQTAALALTPDTERARTLGVGGPDADQHRYDSHVVLVEGDAAHLSSQSALSASMHRRPHPERDQELVGLFTPAFLPALGQPPTSILLRTSSEPPGSSSAARDDDPTTASNTVRSNSDTAVPVASKRPSQLQLTHRTSSSGSSADGKLTSALKSPTQSAKPKRKRVSLAVGDVIVAPSDSVPVALSNNSTPSHSRVRSPASAPETSSMQARPSSPLLPSADPGTRRTAEIESAEQQPRSREATQDSPQARSPPQPSSRRIDPDGDLFDLEDEEANPFPEDPEFENPSEDEEGAVVGRIDRNSTMPLPSSESPGDRYDEDEGLVPEYDDAVGDHIDFRPGSANASQQPTRPGFRRPSVSMDPVYTGIDWTRAEHDAVVNDAYGSGYARSEGRTSFTAGSLGESYMARNAENLMRNRVEREQSQQVRPK